MQRLPSRTRINMAAVACMVTALAMLLTGCVKNPGDTQNLERRSDTVRVRSKEETAARHAAQTHVLRITNIHESDYVPLPDLARAMGYHGAWVNHSTVYGVGDHDVIWSFRIGQSEMTKAGTKITMPGPAVLHEGILYVPVQGLQPLFGAETTMTGDASTLTVAPRPILHEAGADGSTLSFADAGRTLKSSAADAKAAQTIARAKQYIGRNYEFGAAPYGAGGTFDCSSFTQHIMLHAGAKLPRTAIEQARQGTAVSRDSLKPGDLLFFNVPDRYKSSSVPGHVGIYMGGGQMIHASPQPRNGVQVTDLNKIHWKQQFLYARRVL